MIPARPLLVVLLLTGALAGSKAQAQGGTEPVPHDGPPGFIEQVRDAATGHRRPAPLAITVDALQGPPTPAVLAAVAGMSDQQLARYLAAYRTHMSATWESRWRVVSALRLLDRAVQSGDTDAANYYQGAAGELWRQVHDRDEAFEDEPEPPQQETAPPLRGMEGRLAARGRNTATDR
jgi:hypothetical protein